MPYMLKLLTTQSFQVFDAIADKVRIVESKVKFLLKMENIKCSVLIYNPFL